MNRAPPVGVVDLALPVGMVDLAPPVAEVKLAPPVDVVNLDPPVGVVNLAPPVGVVNLAPPVGVVNKVGRIRAICSRRSFLFTRSLRKEEATLLMIHVTPDQSSNGLVAVIRSV